MKWTTHKELDTLSPERIPALRQSDYAVSLHQIERELKGLTERLMALRCALLTENHSPVDLLSLLSQQSGEFLTVADLSRLLKVEKRTIYGLRKEGLPCHRIGKELRFDPLEVADWLRKRHQG